MTPRSGTQPRSRGLLACWLEAGRRAQPAVGERHRLEQRAHLPLTLAHQSRPSALEFLRVVESGALGKRLGPQVDADRAQEIALIDRTVDGGAGGARASRHRGEIDMRGEVALAGRNERVDISVRAQGLQSVAKPGDGVAVVDQQGRAALFRDPGAKFEHQPMAGRVHFQDFTVRRVRPDIGLGLVSHAEDKRALAVYADRALTPLTAHAHKLAHGQGVEKLVADHYCGPVRDFLERLRPGDRYAAVDEQIVLHRRQRRARLDEPDVERVAKGRNNARSASLISVPRPGPSSMSRTGSGEPMLDHTSADQSPINSPNIWDISGAVVKSPVAPNGSRFM